MTNQTQTLKEIRDGVFALLETITGDGKALAGCGKFHEVGPASYPFASVEPWELSPATLLSNVEVMRPYGFNILVQYAVGGEPTVNGIPAVLNAWNNCMDAANAVMDALDRATNLGLPGVLQITPATPRAGKATVGDGLCVFYIIDVAIWTVFDKVEE